MSDEILNDISRTIGRIEAKQDSMAADITDVKAITQDYKQNKNRIIGACLAISAAAGGSISTIAKYLGIGS